MERTIATINLEVDLRALGQKDMTRSFEGAARQVEGLGDAASVVCRIAARIEAASPLPARRADRITDALRDHADPHITILDQPGLLLGVGVATAGKLRRRTHRYHRPLPNSPSSQRLTLKDSSGSWRSQS